MQYSGALTETRMVRSSKRQVKGWTEAAKAAGYRSVSEWIRTQLDVAAGCEVPVEVVGDAKAIAVYVPNRATDRRPFLVAMAKYDTPEKLVQLILEIVERPWCTPPALKAFLTELAQIVETAEPKRKPTGRAKPTPTAKPKPKPTPRPSTKAKPKATSKAKPRRPARAVR